MRLLVAAALALAMSFPALAAPSCQFVLSDVMAQLDAQKIKFEVLKEDRKVEFLAALAEAVALKTGTAPDMSSVTDVLIAEMDGQLFFGLVIGGCLTSPQPLAAYLPAEKLSGWTPIGIFA